jgi:hypothetical protein
MKKMNTLLCTLALALIAFAPVVQAKMLPDADTREVRAYTLTDASFAKYVNATHKLREVKFENCVDDDDDDAQDTIASSVARIDAVPGAKAAIQAAGLSSREYVVLAYALLENGMASYLLQTPGGKLPDGVNTANVDFVRRHSSELHQLANETEDESCEKDDND